MNKIEFVCVVIFSFSLAILSCFGKQTTSELEDSFDFKSLLGDEDDAIIFDEDDPEFEELMDALEQLKFTVSEDDVQKIKDRIQNENIQIQVLSQSEFNQLDKEDFQKLKEVFQKYLDLSPNSIKIDFIKIPMDDDHYYIQAKKLLNQYSANHSIQFSKIISTFNESFIQNQNPKAGNRIIQLFLFGTPIHAKKMNSFSNYERISEEKINITGVNEIMQQMTQIDDSFLFDSAELTHFFLNAEATLVNKIPFFEYEDITNWTDYRSQFSLIATVSNSTIVKLIEITKFEIMNSLLSLNWGKKFLQFYNELVINATKNQSGPNFLSLLIGDPEIKNLTESTIKLYFDVCSTIIQDIVKKGFNYQENIPDTKFLAQNQNFQEELDFVAQFTEQMAHQGDIHFERSAGQMNMHGSSPMNYQPNYDAAAQYFSHAAESGDVISNYYLSFLYLRGQGVKQDLNASFYYMEKAARGGLVQAIVSLAEFHLNGIGTEKNATKAVELLNSAAAKENPQAFCNLGLIYFEGIDEIQKDQIKAVSYLKKAADLDDPLAFLFLGNAYREGNGTEISYDKAKYYFKKLIDQNVGPSESVFYELGGYYHFLNRNYDLSFNYHLMTTLFGKRGAATSLAFLIEENLTKEIQCKYDDINLCMIPLYFWDLLLNNSEAGLELGNIFYEGSKNVPVNYELAISFYNQSSQLNNSEAMYNVGYMIEHGLGIEKNEELAAEYYYSLADGALEEKFDFEAIFPAFACYLNIQFRRLSNNYYPLNWIYESSSQLLTSLFELVSQ